MKRDEVIAKLREHQAVLRARGVRHAALFGSVARGDERPDSDIDIMLEFDPEAQVSLFDYVGIKDFVVGLFAGSVDVVDRDALKPHIRPPAEASAVYAF
jgi:predicted nucleotidyltransferase